jgi:hypothetical protein
VCRLIWQHYPLYSSERERERRRGRNGEELQNCTGCKQLMHAECSKEYTCLPHAAPHTSAAPL